jgi:hypothetical protein
VTSNPTPPTGPTGVNGVLDGKVLYREGTTGTTTEVMLDLLTGAPAGFPLNLDFYPALNTQEYAAIDTSKRANNGGKDQLVIMNLTTGTNNLNPAPGVLINQAVSGTARLSPDRTHVAAMWQNVAGGETTPQLTVFSTTGVVQSRVNGASAYAWLPNGKLLTAQGSQLVTLDVSNTGVTSNPVTLATLPGAAVDLAVSRDGTRIAAALPAGASSHVWIMDSGGGNQRQLTTSASNERNPEFSPNGTWLLVRQDTASNCPSLYAVWTGATTTQTLNGSSNASVVRLASKMGSNAAVNVCAGGQAAWVQ